MSVTISKGKAFRCTVAVDDDRLKAMRAAPELAEKALMAGADYWHTGILPKHFERGASGTYGYAPRSPTYLKSKGKSGKPGLVFSGSLRRDLRSKAAYRQVGKSVELKMTARILNVVPNMAENSPDLYVKHKNKTKRGYPNLKREIKMLTEDDRAAVAVVARDTLAAALDPASNTTTIGPPSPGSSL